MSDTAKRSIAPVEPFNDGQIISDSATGPGRFKIASNGLFRGPFTLPEFGLPKGTTDEAKPVEKNTNQTAGSGTQRAAVVPSGIIPNIKNWTPVIVMAALIALFYYHRG